MQVRYFPVSQLDEYGVAEGDLVVVKSSGSAASIQSGKMALIDAATAGSFIFSNFLMRLRPCRILPRFLFYVMTSGRVKAMMPSLCEASTYPNIRIPEYLSVLVQSPPLSEQRAIAEALSDADALLDGLDRLIVKKRDLKQAAMQQLLTGKTRLPGFSGEWETKRFDDVFERVNSKPYQIPTAWYQATGAYPVVDQGKLPVIAFSDKSERLLRCPADGLVVFGDHTCIVKYVCVDFIVGADGTQVLRAKHPHIARFYAYQLQYSGVVSTGYSRHFGVLKEGVFAAPPPAEQLAIATVLADMDAELEALEARREKVQSLKHAMMQELLTGKTRLVAPEGAHA